MMKPPAQAARMQEKASTVNGKREATMTRHNFIFISIAFLLLLLGVAPPVWSGEAVDNRLYAALLGMHVKNGNVNYQGFKQDEANLDEYLRILEAVDSRKLSRNDQLAFYINAYNAWTLKLVLSGYPGIQSIKDLGNLLSTPWKKKICRIEGQILSLDELEHEIIRPRFQDPRVHFAVNCASKSCPPLISAPYEGSHLDAQLDASARAFINNPQRNHLEGKILYVSKIFKWYGEDFKGGIVNFFLKYAEGNLKKELETRKEQVELSYLDYDWSLNGR